MEGVDRELTLAALYSFLFVLVLFLVDELFRTSLFTYNNLLVSMLTLFTLFSSIYWLSKWTAYVLDLLRNNGKRTYSLVTDSKLSKYMQFLHLSFLKNDWWRMAIEIAYFLLIVMLSWFLNFDGGLLIYELVILGILPPYIFEGLYHLYSSEQSEPDSDEGYKTTLNHFGRLLFMSILVSLVFFALDYTLFKDRNMLLPYDSLRYLKMFSVGFVIFNGLIIPSVLPFHTYRYLSKSVLKQPSKLQKKVDKEIEVFLCEVRNITHNCTVD